MADCAQLAVVEAVHARQAAAQHGARRGRDETQGGGAQQDGGGTGQDDATQAGARGIVHTSGTTIPPPPK